MPDMENQQFSRDQKTTHNFQNLSNELTNLKTRKL